jgi:hypothetical protein
MNVDSIVTLLEFEIFLSSPHLLLEDTFRALLATTYSVSQHTADVHMRLTPICYACKLGDCNCYFVYRWRSRGD